MLKFDKTYTLIINNYLNNKPVVKHVQMFLAANNFVENNIKPQFCFVIGGDGSFLRAVHSIWKSLDYTIIVPISGGLLNFYSTFNDSNREELFKQLQTEKLQIQHFPLLEAQFNHNQVGYAINEVKVVDHIKTLRTNVHINQESLQIFRGSGLVFSTTSGSTGYMKSMNGAILVANHILWEMQEIAPVSNVKFSTINSAIIMSSDQVVNLTDGLKGRQIVLDTFHVNLLADDVVVKISSKQCRVLYDPHVQTSLILRLKNLFSLNRYHGQ